MSQKTKILIFVILIVWFGLSSRFFTFQNLHPDSDEMFELRNMQNLKPQDVLKQNTFYGDHTSFPGEYLIHYLPMKALNLFEKKAKIDIEHQHVEGINKMGFWILAIPKILITLLSIVLFYILCTNFLNTPIGYITAFSLFMLNTHLIYHAFSLRPYGILPELAIINLYLAGQENKKPWFYALHLFTIFFTCIYHAYGPLIAVLPVLMYRTKRYSDMILPICAILGVWIYYAAYNTFGMTPNKVQSVVNAFQFITKENFLGGIVDSIFEGSLIILATTPFILWGLTKIAKPQMIWLGVMILLPLTLIILVDIKTSYWIHPRQYIWLVPAIALWCGSLVEGGLNVRRA